MTLYKWSQTAANNATVDPSINWQEGQAPSSINDSARAMMASIAKHRDDIAGAIVTGGTATAYTVTSYEAFDTLTRLNGQIIAFTPHVTNGATVTLNVDSLGAMPLRSAHSVELLPGVLIQGTPYLALYNHSDAAFYLHGVYGNPYNVPLAGGMDFWGATVPNSAFAFPAGQAISRTIYAPLFAIMGTTYGAGDGSTTFNLPDKTGRVSAMKESSATRLTSSYFGGSSTNLGAVGGAESLALSIAQLPTGITSSGVNSISITSTVQTPQSGTMGATQGGLQTTPINGTYGFVTSTGSNSISVTSNNTSGIAHRTVQPTIICNYIIRIL
jgi:microcystin-dependent protein